MSNALDGCSHIVDTNGLHEIATAKGNVKRVFIHALEAGEIAVPTIVWQEFKDLYEDEASALVGHIGTKINMKRAYQIGAASIADGANSSISQSPYDCHADLCAASMCQIEDRILLTTEGQAQYYEGMNCCEVQSIKEWLEGQ